VFNGISQVLDHIFVPKALSATAGAVQYDVIHVNSEFAAQASDHDPQVVRIRPVAATPVTAGAISAVPNRVLQGTFTLAVLHGFEPNTRLVLRVDDTQVATVTTDKHGAALALVRLPLGAGAGSHTLTATTPSGARASASLTVIGWGFGARG
jgi:hypothetical protein